VITLGLACQIIRFRWEFAERRNHLIPASANASGCFDDNSDDRLRHDALPSIAMDNKVKG
jgi:hypothetical protein